MIFRQPISESLPISAPDAPISLIKTVMSDYPSNAAGAWGSASLGSVTPPLNLTPRRFLGLIVSPQDYLFWGYTLDILLLAAATVLLLKSLGLSWPTSGVGALAMALSCHTTTLISAGHMSKNGMMPFAVLTIAFLHLAITRHSSVCFVLCGLCAGTALSEHYDVAYFFCLLAALYGIYLIIITRKSISGWKRVGRLLLGLTLAGIFTMAIFLPSLSYITHRLAPAREEIVKEGEKKDPQKQWIFATNWSLPPEELIEFLVPGIFGDETGSQKRPYWGRTGRSISFDRNRQGMRNLRQHGLYLGVFQLMLAAFATASILRHWLKRGRSSDQPLDRHEIRLASFWIVALPVLIMFAMGRFAPLYRAFYNLLPYAKNIRAPIKFMHTVELTTVIMTTFGLEIIYRRLTATHKDRRHPVPKVLAVSSFLLAGILFVSCMVILMRMPSIARYLSSLGFADSASKLGVSMLASILRSGVLLLIFGGLVTILRTRYANARLFPPILMGSIALIITLDLVAINSRYIRSNRNAPLLYSSNDLSEYLTANSNEHSRVVAPVQDGLSRSLPEMFRYHEIPYLEPPQTSFIDPRLKAFYSVLIQNPIRLWQLTSCKSVFGPTKQLSQLLTLPGFSPESYFEVAPDKQSGLRITNKETRSSNFMLIANSNALPRAAVFYSWKKISSTDIAKEISDPAWRPEKYVLVETESVPSSSGSGYQPATIKYYSPHRLEIILENDKPGIAFVSDMYDKSWSATVDGRSADIIRANGVMRGVFVPAGSQKLVMSFHRPYSEENKVRLTAIAIATLMAACFLLLNLRQRLSNKQAD